MASPWCVALVLVVGCGRFGFDELAGPVAGSPFEPDAGSPAAGCAGARVIAPSALVMLDSLDGARAVEPPPGCVGGAAVALRFTPPVRHVSLRITPAFAGSYALGAGCPVTAGGATLLCGPLAEGETTPGLGVDVDADTYLVIYGPPGPASMFGLRFDGIAVGPGPSSSSSPQ